MGLVHNGKMKNQQQTVWLFCRVIDNYGDIGVAWRLAKQLAHEQGFNVVLWVDDWDAFGHLLPDLTADKQEYAGIYLQHWREPFMAAQLTAVPAADAVIETFACDLPAAVLAWMQTRQVVWLNLEYLSAETWVDGIHLLPSLQSNGLSKHFFCPGFTAKTGGLSCEQALREAVALEPMKSHISHAHVTALAESLSQQAYRTHGATSVATTTLQLYVFGYPDAVLQDWLAMWQGSDMPLKVSLATGSLLAQWQTWYPQLAALKQVGDEVVLGQLTVCVAPFVAQAAFDGVLQAADVCVVRGEDSVLRALWQGKAFWWQIYRQEHGAHHAKLHAFWQRCFDAVVALQDADVQQVWQAHQALSDELNGVQILSAEVRQHAWQLVVEKRQVLAVLLQAWRGQLWQQASLSTQLANFIRLQLK